MRAEQKKADNDFGFHWNNTRHLLEGDVFSPPFIAENREVRSYADVEHYFNEFGY